MSAQPIVGSSPAPSAPTNLPEVVITEDRFEGKEVGQTLITIGGTAKMVPQSIKDEHRVLTTDDIVTIQVDVKVTGLHFDVDANGLLTRVQRVRPIEGTATVIDVVRARDTRVR